MFDDNPPNWQEVVGKLLTCRTQKELSTLTGVPQSTISEILNGMEKKRLTFENGFALLTQLKADQNKTP